MKSVDQLIVENPNLREALGILIDSLKYYGPKSVLAKWDEFRLKDSARSRPVGEVTIAPKPPLGVSPAYIFYAQRIKDLQRAVQERVSFKATHYETIENDDIIHEWIKELGCLITIIKKSH